MPSFCADGADGLTQIVDLHCDGIFGTTTARVTSSPTAAVAETRDVLTAAFIPSWNRRANLGGPLTPQNGAKSGAWFAFRQAAMRADLLTASTFSFAAGPTAANDNRNDAAKRRHYSEVERRLHVAWAYVDAARKPTARATVSGCRVR